MGVFLKVVAIIPARMGSSRFPGKPLAPLLGRPMIEHVYHRVVMSKAIDETIVATCDREIAEASARFGAPVVMTSSRHERASDRVAEAAEACDADILVLVQGDEPMTVPEMIDAAVEPMLQDPSIDCINLAKRIETEEEFLNPNTIKVVMNQQGDALCFSRSPIPTIAQKSFSEIQAFKQVCIIPFRRQALADYAALPPTPLEVAESIDMMRFLEHGRVVRMVETDFETQAVDTPDDLAAVSLMIAKDPAVARYPASNGR